MCMQKVANSRGKRGGGGGGGGDHEGRNWPFESSSMLFGLDREREMSAMVSALTHVVSGGGATSSVSSDKDSGGGSRTSTTISGNKREREDYDDASPHLSRLSSTAFGHFSHPESSFSLGKYLCTFFFSLFPIFFT